VLLYASAGLMILFYGEPAPRHYREAFSIAHRVFGVFLIVLPPLSLLRGRADWRIHVANMREGWRLTRTDIRWLLLFPMHTLNSRIELPEQGKFNAAEKLNFMMVSACYPLYIATGILIWLPGVAFVAYLSHYAMAAVGVPLVAGHIFMATVAPETRVGLSGMITGWVDRGWAKRHYRRWYREQFEPDQPAPGLHQQLSQPAMVRCGECAAVQTFPSWEDLIERSFQVAPLVCPSCNTPTRLVRAGQGQHSGETIVRHLQVEGVNTPLEAPGTPART
jgi:formate dehydrogenase subunit gamma